MDQPILGDRERFGRISEFDGGNKEFYTLILEKTGRED